MLEGIEESDELIIACFETGPNYPQRVIALADWGLSHNSTVTRDHAVASAAAAPNAMVHYIADFCVSLTTAPISYPVFWASHSASKLRSALHFCHVLLMVAGAVLLEGYMEYFHF